MALCDISDLLACGMLRKMEGGGRGTGYELATSDASAGTLPSSVSSSDEVVSKKGL